MPDFPDNTNHSGEMPVDVALDYTNTGTDNTSPDQPIDSTDNVTNGENPRIQKSSLDGRHLFRQLVVQRLYEIDYRTHSEQILQPYEMQLGENLELEKPTTKLFKKLEKNLDEVESLANAVINHKGRLDEVIVKLAPAWPLSQINSVDLQILRLSIYEGFVSKNIPAKVAIDEGIELARDFGTENNIKFVSGVLGNLFAHQSDYNF